jgi:HlyD family secretion protein
VSRLAFGFATLLSLHVEAALAQSAGSAADEAARRKVTFAAPGRIEGSAEPVSIGASITGLIEKVAVRQGDLVNAGDVLVRIACRDLEAQLAVRTSEHAAAEAVHQKLVNGPRPEDIAIAEAAAKLAGARLTEAQSRMKRSTALFDRNAVSAAVHDIDDRDVAVATAELDSARNRVKLLRLGTREEELSEANAKMAAAFKSIEAAKAELAKCEVRSPLTGVVLRKHVSEGELVSLTFPRPLLTLSEVAIYRVRAEVDEQDVRRVRLGQRAEIVVHHSDRGRLYGRVATVAPMMGRRQILTSDPADKSDRDVMEVVIDLEDRPENLPIGLRVSVIFLE